MFSYRKAMKSLHLPQAFCEVEPHTCFASTVLSGCALQKPCWPLEVDDCVMDPSRGAGDGSTTGMATERTSCWLMMMVMVGWLWLLWLLWLKLVEVGLYT